MAHRPATLFNEPIGSWRAVRLLNLYRITIAGLFGVLWLRGEGPSFLGQAAPELFVGTALAYLAFALAWSVASRYHWPSYPLQVYGQFAADLIGLSLLTFTSGGITSGLGMLLVPAVAGASLLTGGRIAALFAALAALALLAVELAGQAYGVFAQSAFGQTGMLGAALFATAVLASALGHRARRSEALATERGLDLANMAELNEHIVEHLNDGVLVVDHRDRVRLMNQAASDLLDQPAGTLERPIDEVAPAVARALARWRERPAPSPVPLDGEPGQGSELQARFRLLGIGRQAAVLVSLEDTAELGRRAQEMKLTSLGRLAASIAHEVRNPLGAISHAGQLLAESTALTEADRGLVQIIEAQSRRMNAIVEDVLALSRRDRPRQEAIAIGDWIARCAAELEQQEGLPRGTVRVETEGGPRELCFDPNHLQQVVWNLCQNALQHARRGRKPPTIHLQTGEAGYERRPYLDVIDDGPGIAPEHQAQLFEPFFTTNPRGTGLGLYIARELCELNEGSLEYIPLPNAEGACFRIHFPPPSCQSPQELGEAPAREPPQRHTA